MYFPVAPLQRKKQKAGVMKNSMNKMHRHLLCSLSLEIIHVYFGWQKLCCHPLPQCGKITCRFSGAYEYKLRNTTFQSYLSFSPSLSLTLSPPFPFVWWDAHTYFSVKD